MTWFPEPGMAFILAIIMAFVHLLGEELEERISGYRVQVVSFSSGVSITYIFMQLLPEFHRIALSSSKLIFMFPLIGFSSIHLLEKHVAKLDIPKEQMSEDYGEIHVAFLFLYHGAIGYLIASLLAESMLTGLLFFIPILLHTAVSSFSLTELHEEIAEKTLVKTGVAIAPLLGVLLYEFNILKPSYFNPIFGTVVGMFFYVVIRDSIPSGRKGKPLEYTIGMTLYLLVILAAHTI